MGNKLKSIQKRTFCSSQTFELIRIVLTWMFEPLNWILISCNLINYTNYEGRLSSAECIEKKNWFDASSEVWTHDPWFTRPVLYHWAIEAHTLHMCNFIFVSGTSVFNWFFLRKDLSIYTFKRSNNMLVSIHW